MQARILNLEDTITKINERTKVTQILVIASAVLGLVLKFFPITPYSAPQPPSIPAQSVGSNNSVHVGAAPKPESKRTFLTVKEVAERENVSERTIITAISQGRIEPQPERDGRAWVVSANYRFLPIITADSGTNQENQHADDNR